MERMLVSSLCATVAATRLPDKLGRHFTGGPFHRYAHQGLGTIDSLRCCPFGLLLRSSQRKRRVRGCNRRLLHSFATSDRRIEYPPRRSASGESLNDSIQIVAKGRSFSRQPGEIHLRFIPRTGVPERSHPPSCSANRRSQEIPFRTATRNPTTSQGELPFAIKGL